MILLLLYINAGKEGPSAGGPFSHEILSFLQLIVVVVQDAD